MNCDDKRVLISTPHFHERFQVELSLYWIFQRPDMSDVKSGTIQHSRLQYINIISADGRYEKYLYLFTQHKLYHHSSGVELHCGSRGLSCQGSSHTVK